MLKSLKIGAIRYEVSEKPDLHSFNGEWKKTFLDGHIKHGEAKIYIDEELDPQVKTATIIHEAVHGILVNAGAGEEVSEKAIVALGFGLMSLLQDNPELVKMVMDGNRPKGLFAFSDDRLREMGIIA